MKILKVPHEFKQDHKKEDKILFALAMVEEGSKEDVYKKLQELSESSLNISNQEVDEILTTYYNEGLLKGKSMNNVMYYNLNKMEKPNSGKVDPDLLDETLPDFEEK